MSGSVLEQLERANAYALPRFPELDDLGDVDEPAPNDLDILQYSAVDSQWHNVPGSAFAGDIHTVQDASAVVGAGQSAAGIYRDEVAGVVTLKEILATNAFLTVTGAAESVNLKLNVGTGATQLAVGDHTHVMADVTDLEAGVAQWENKTFFGGIGIRNPDDTKTATLRVGNITGPSDVTLGITGLTETVSMVDRAETLTNKRLGTGTSIQDSDASNLYLLVPGDLTSNVNLQLPSLAGNDTVVFEAHAAALTAKTIDDASNTVRASSLATSGAPVVVVGAAPPSAGQVLTASGATTASWGTPAAAAPPMVTINADAVATRNVSVATGLAAGQTVDGVPLNTGAKVLITEQTAPLENGLYSVPAAGAASRDAALPIGAAGAKLRVNVAGGLHNRGLWLCRNDSTADTVGTYALRYVNSSQYDYDDNVLVVSNAADQSKQVALSVASVAAGTVRTLTAPDASGTILLEAAVQDVSNKRLGAGTSVIDSDASHVYNLVPGNLTSDVNLQLPVITSSGDTVVVTNQAQTLQNKTITLSTNLVRASELGTTGASVGLNAGAPPTVGQVLTATSATAAAWSSVAAPLSRRTWLSSMLIDCTNSNELEYAPTIKDLSPATVGCWVMPRAATVTAVTVILLGSAAGTITAGTMDIGIGTRSLGDVYTNTATVGTLTSVLNADGQLVVSGLAHAFAAGDRVALRLTTDASFAWSNGANNDASILVEFSSA